MSSVAARARTRAAIECGYPNAAVARAAGDVEALNRIHAAQLAALRNMIPNTQPQGGAMSLFTHHAEGRIGDREALVCALREAGWSAGPAESLVRKIEVTAVIAESPKPRQPWRAWTDDELETVADLIAAAGYRLPSMEGSRNCAALLGRSVRSVRSQAERILAAREVATEAL